MFNDSSEMLPFSVMKVLYLKWR